MNIRTSTDINAAIRAAEDLHDLHAGQTGTRRKPRKRPTQRLTDSTGNDEAPTAQGDYRSPGGPTPIQRLAALAATAQDHADVVNAIVDPDVILATDPDDDEMSALNDTLAAIDRTIMALPATCWADVEAKLIAWQELIADPGCIHSEDHLPLFFVLQMDVARLSGRQA